ncbi:MAG: hypothetical protein A3K22_00015 [Deltaproteobacteria bacterium RBG_16_42_7]|nr:MAG: hypothetical protein A3K22_00015 [Deltaproteobacteria bacterium RBG_16_42_7]
MKRVIFLILGTIICFVINASSDATQKIVAQKVDIAPVIDGKDTDPAWVKAKSIISRDKVANIDISLKAVHTNKEMFFLVSFPDPDESRTHKSWVWDKSREIYKMGNDREDLFIFKWSMEAQPVDLSIYADNPYKSDVWFWKACRTDPAGYADDKIDTLTAVRLEDAIELKSKSGKVMYLLRKGDAGEPAFKTKLQVEYKGDVVPRFTYQIPRAAARM